MLIIAISVTLIGTLVYTYVLGYQHVIPLPVVAVGDEIYVKGRIVSWPGPGFTWGLIVDEVMQDPNGHVHAGDPARAVNTFGGYIDSNITIWSNVTVYALYNTTGYVPGSGAGEIDINGPFYFIRLS